MKKMEKSDTVKVSERKKISRQIKDQINPLVQKLMSICSNVKALNRKAEWEEIETILKLLKLVQGIEAKHQLPRSDRSNHWKRFFEWCSENGAEFTSIAVKQIEEGNYGVFAEKDIKENELFLTVPRKIMMSEATAKSSKLGPFISTDPILLNMPNVQVAMHLLTEAVNPKSFWLPYISILPSSYSTILYYSFEELKELQGSPVIDEVFKIIRSVVRQYCYFFQLFQKDPLAVSLNIGQYFTYDLYRWAVSSVMTRQNVVPSADEQEEILSLIPLFDMCNHANGKLTTDFNVEKDSLISYACQPFSRDQQVFMFYGQRNNGEFFVHNGFVDPENENDAIEIKIGISNSDPLHLWKSGLCAKLGISIIRPFYIYKGKGISKELLTFVQVNVMKSTELEKCLEDEKDEIDNSLVEGSDLMKRAYSFLKDRLFLLHKSYRTTIEEDEELVKQDVFESAHHRTAILLRLCEKKILTSGRELCVKKLEEL